MVGGPSFSDRHYMPVLRTAPGELAALRSGDAHAPPLDDYTPLFLVVPKNFYDPVPGARRQLRRSATPAEVDALLSSRAADIAGWVSGRNRRCLVDVREFNQHHGGHHLAALFTKLHAAGSMTPVPVTYVHDNQQHAEVKAIQGSAAVGVAMRLRLADKLTWPSVQRALQNCGVAPGDTDLVIDASTVESATIRGLKRHAVDVLLDAVREGAWRTITLLSGAAKRGAQYDRFEYFARYDWALWRMVRESLRKKDSRLPAFGDYGVLPAAYTLPERVNPPSPYVAYTSHRFWMVMRSRAAGRGARQTAYGRICQALTATPQFLYCTSRFSDGDKLIEDVALGTAVKYGQGVTWVQAMTSHHAFFVTAQLKTVP